MNRSAQATNLPIPDALDLLAPSHELLKSTGWKRWEAELREELKAMGDAGWLVGSVKSENNPAFTKLLAMTGMSWPQSQEEQLRLYLAFRAVVCFVTRKLDQLQAESSRYEQLKKEQVQAHGDIGIPRNVAR